MKQQTMFRAWFAISVAFVSVAGPCLPSRAALASRPLSTLIAASEVIARGRIVAAELIDGGGVATIEISEVLKGRLDSTRTKIRWSKDPEDERLGNVGSERLLFLRRTDGNEYEAAQYGRSYLELYRDLDTRKYVVVLTGRANLIERDLPISIAKTRVLVEVLRPGSQWVTIDCVPLSELTRAIRSAGTAVP